MKLKYSKKQVGDVIQLYKGEKLVDVVIKSAYRPDPGCGDCIFNFGEMYHSKNKGKRVSCSNVACTERFRKDNCDVTFEEVV